MASEAPGDLVCMALIDVHQRCHHGTSAGCEERAGEALDLTSTEFSLAQVLLQRAGTVVEKRDLYLAALGREPVRFDRSVDMHLSNLRRKLGPLPGGGPRIETVRGIGYLYVQAEDA